MDGATRASRDSLAVVATRPAAATDAADRPVLLGRRDGQQAVVQPRMVSAASGSTAGPTSTAGAAIPDRVQAGMAADRALFTVLTAGRQAVRDQADVLVARGTAGLLKSSGGGTAFAVLLGSSVSVPATADAFQAAQERSRAQASARESARTRAGRAYATATAASPGAAAHVPAGGSGGSGASEQARSSDQGDPDAEPGRQFDSFG